MITTTYPFDYLKNCTDPLIATIIDVDKIQTTLSDAEIRNLVNGGMIGTTLYCTGWLDLSSWYITITAIDTVTKQLTYDRKTVDNDENIVINRYVDTSDSNSNSITKGSSADTIIPVVYGPDDYQNAIKISLSYEITVEYDPADPYASNLIISLSTFGDTWTVGTEDPDKTGKINVTGSITNCTIPEFGTLSGDPSTYSIRVVVYANTYYYPYNSYLSVSLNITNVSLKYICDDTDVETGDLTLNTYNNGWGNTQFTFTV
ncbi:MAG: hypothetical protein WC877_01670 [Dehalococcoidales bacterium]|jgi:hypothetical protein